MPLTFDSDSKAEEDRVYAYDSLNDTYTCNLCSHKPTIQRRSWDTHIRSARHVDAEHEAKRARERAECRAKAEAEEKAEIERVEKAREDAAAKVKHFNDMYVTCFRVAENLAKERLISGTGHSTLDCIRVRRDQQMASKVAVESSAEVKVDARVVDFVALLQVFSGQSSADVKTNLTSFLAHESTIVALTHAQITQILDLVPASSAAGEAKLRELNEWTPWHDKSIELHVVRDAVKLDRLGVRSLLRAWSGSTEGILRGAEEEMEFFRRYLGRPHEKLAKSMKTSFGKAEAQRRLQSVRDLLQSLQSEGQSLPPLPPIFGTNDAGDQGESGKRQRTNG